MQSERIRSSENVQFFVPVRLRLADVHDLARMVVRVAKKAEPVEHTDPSMLRRGQGVLRLTHTADSNVYGTPRWEQLGIQLCSRFVKGLQQPTKHLYLLRIENAQRLEEPHVLVAGLGARPRRGLVHGLINTARAANVSCTAEQDTTLSKI